MSKQRTYLDHNASSPIRPAALEELVQSLARLHGNPSSIHQDGVRARAHLDDARVRITNALSASHHSLIFTSGATESNNLAILGARLGPRRRRLLTTTIEHPSVLRPIQELAARSGLELSYLTLDQHGQVDLEAACQQIDSTVALVSVQTANHETGVLQPIAPLASYTARAGALIHTDAAQAPGRVPICSEVDFISIASHKLGGPLGIGALLVADGQNLSPIVIGGSQESGLRAGTLSPALAIGFAVATEEACRALDTLHRTHTLLRDSIVNRLSGLGITFRLITPVDRAMPNTLCVAFPPIDRFTLQMNLDLLGISVSTGAACASGGTAPSPVLAALGIPQDIAGAAIRISLGWATSNEDIDHLIEALPKALERSISRRS